jgi:PAS domain S-box-containing protein
MEKWFQNAISHPWPFVALALAWVIYKVFIWIAVRLLDEKTGIIPKHLASAARDSKSMKESIVMVAEANASALASFQVNVLNSLQDNTEAVASLEKQLVSAIQASPDDQELFDVLFYKNPIPICFVGNNLKFIEVNTACEELWGYSKAELENIKLEDITSKSDIDADIQNIEMVLTGARSRYRMEKTYLCKNGDKVRCAQHVFRYPSRGAFLHFISIIIPLD